MLFPSNQIEDGEQLFIIMDFMRRIFPVAVDTVVVPYFPVANDMVNVKGDDRAVWKARIYHQIKHHQGEISTANTNKIPYTDAEGAGQSVI